MRRTRRSTSRPLTPLNIVAQRFPVQAPHWVFDYIQPQLEALLRQGSALPRRPARHDDASTSTCRTRRRRRSRHWISEFEDASDAHNGALVAIDPRTSEILTYVGSRDYFRDDIEGRNDNASSFNSPGSTLKPFTYVAAFERLGWGPGTEILDTPVSFPDQDDKTFTPRNPSGDFHGPISAHDALGNSLNIPAVKVARQRRHRQRRRRVQEVRHHGPRRPRLRSVDHGRRHRREAGRRRVRVQRARGQRRHARRADIA